MPNEVTPATAQDIDNIGELQVLDASSALGKDSPLVLTATLEPVAGLQRFQPAGFPEIGHVIYRAPSKGGAAESICIVDSAASMANHLESLCVRSPFDPTLVDDLDGMPYVRCVTGELKNGKLGPREVVVTSLTEGHRLASTYFLEGKRVVDAEGTLAENHFQDALADEMGVVLKSNKSVAHPPPEKWWNVFAAIFKYDPNALVHGVMFPQWQIKIPRVLTAHLEAFGVERVERSGVKFDRLGKTLSGQPIFAVDDETAREIRATFVIDLALVRSFGRLDAGQPKGINEDQKSFLVALALWKINRLLERPFRFRSGCHLECSALRLGYGEKAPAVRIDVDIKGAIKGVESWKDANVPAVTDVYWERNRLYEEKPEKTSGKAAANGGADELEEAGEEGD